MPPPHQTSLPPDPMMSSSLAPLVVAGDNIEELAHSNLNSLRNDFSSILRGESTAFSSFLNACARFESFVRSCRDSLKAETLDAIAAFTSPLAILASTFSEMHEEKETVISQFSDDVTDLLSSEVQKISLVDDATPDATHNPPPYLEASSKWLMEHWTNPYPSVQVRQRIADQAQVPRKDIDAWFIDARKRIGWNALRRQHFDNKRADIVQAACAFDQSDYNLQSSAIDNEFAEIQRRATALYEEKFLKSTLAQKLDGVVRDMSPSLKADLNAEKQKNRVESNRKRKRAGRDAYPTPQASPSSTSEDLSSPTASEFFIPAAPTNPRKRRSSSEDIEETLSLSSRPMKRLRASSAETEVSSVSSPISPTEAFFTPPVSPTSNSQTPTLPSVDLSMSRKRKRRLSDGFQFPAAKRPQIRMQAVSDPLPTSGVVEDLEEWFSRHADVTENVYVSGEIPPPVSVAAPDSSLPLDIELFNFPSLPKASSSTQVLPSVESCGQLPVPDELLSIAPLASAFDVSHFDFSGIFGAPGMDGSTLTFFPSDLLDPSTIQSSSVPSEPSVTLPFDTSFFDNFITDMNLPSMVPYEPASIPVAPRASQLEEVTSTLAALEAEREAKRREAEDLEARARAIRVQFSLP